MLYCTWCPSDMTTGLHGQATEVTHPFDGLFKDNLGKLAPERLNQSGFNEPRDGGWQWHYLDHIICTLLQTDNHISSSSLNFYTPDDLPDAQPMTSKH